MHPLFRLRFVFFLFVTPVLSSGQAQQLFQRTDPLTYIIRLGSEKPGNTDASRIIRMLAEADGQASSTFQYVLSWNQSFKALRSASNRITLQVQHTGVRVNGPIKIRGFDVAPVLMPSWVDFSYQFRPQNSAVPTVYNALRKIVSGTAENTENTITDSTTTGCSMSVTSCYFVYNESAVRKIKDRVDLIKEYFGNEILLDQAYSKVMQVNPQDAWQLEMQNIMLLDVERYLHGLKQRDFDSELELVVYDPIGMRTKVTRIEQEATARRVALNQTKANQFLFFYNMGLDFKTRGRYQQAYDSFMRSIQENPLFAPSLYQLSMMDFEEGRYVESECRARTILDEMVPDPDIDRMTRQQLLRISDKYVELGEERLKQNKIDDALDFLRRAANLCTSLRGMECHSNLEADLQKAHQAKYNSYLDRARAAYQRNDLNQAESEIDQALAYQQVQSRFINSSSEALDMRRAVKQKRYDLSIENARQLASQGDNRGALTVLLQADDLQRKEGLVRSDAYSGLVRSSGRPLFMEQVVAAKQAVQSNDLVNARAKVRQLQESLTRYELTNDAGAVAALNDVSAMIFSQECANAQKNLDDFATQAGDAYDKREFIRSDELIRKALSVSEKTPECRLSEGNLRASLDSMRPAVMYQRMVNDVLALQTQGRAAEAYDSYLKSAQFFKESSVGRFGLNHLDVDSFAYSRCNDGFMNYLVNIHIDKKEYDIALTLFKSILTRNGGKVSSIMGKTLTRLGIELGVRDKRNGTATSWKTGALQYTNGDKRLKALEKGYKEGWKKDQ